MPTTVLQNPFTQKAASQQPQNLQQQQQPQNKSGVVPGKGEQDPPITDPDNKDPLKKEEHSSDDPMMDFSKLWDNPPIDPKNPPEIEETNFLPALDPTKLGETLSKIDFTKNATPEESAAIKAGGDAAEAAHRSVLNKSLRQAMLTSFNVTHKMVESGLTKAQDRFLGKVPSHVKDIIVKSNLTKSSKIMSNPAFAPLIESTRQRFQEKFPKATPDQVSSAVEKYMQDFVKAASTDEEKPPVDNNTKLTTGATDADWDEWLEPELKQ